MRLKLLTLSFYCILSFTTCFAQNTFVFLGSFNWSKDSSGIYVCELDTLSGKLIERSTLKGIRNPSYLTTVPGSSLFYSCTDSKTENAGSVCALNFDTQSYTLTIVSQHVSGGENPVYLSVDNSGKRLVNVNYTESTVSVFTIQADRGISGIDQLIQFSGSSVVSGRQDKSHLHACVFSPDNKYIFLTDLGADKIRRFSFNADNSKPLDETSELDFKTESGHGPRHFRFHPNGRYAYCLGELAGSLSVYSYQDGNLELLQVIYTHPENVIAGFESSDIQFSPDGKFLYASNRGIENNIAIFSVAEDGKLTLSGYQQVYGNHPRNMAIDPSGNFLIVTNVVSNNVVVFRRNTSKGDLEKVFDLKNVPNVSCVQIVKY